MGELIDLARERARRRPPSASPAILTDLIDFRTIGGGFTTKIVPTSAECAKLMRELLSASPWPGASPRG